MTHTDGHSVCSEIQTLNHLELSDVFGKLTFKSLWPWKSRRPRWTWWSRDPMSPGISGHCEEEINIQYTLSLLTTYPQSLRLSRVPYVLLTWILSGLFWDADLSQSFLVFLGPLVHLAGLVHLNRTCDVSYLHRYRLPTFYIVCDF